jgi:fatty-acyl-CoA synthase
MMDVPLTVPSILHRAARFFADREIATRLHDGTIHRTTYGALARRVARLKSALMELGVRPGDRVASFAWNSHRHLELYFAVPAIGAVLHTINVRLAREQLIYLINHAQDRIMIADASLAGILAEIRDEIPTVRDLILMEDRSEPGPSAIAGLDYEELLARSAEDDSIYPIAEESAAGLCYTSGTTGQLKGALYSHRAQYLHAMSICMADALGVSERDVVLPVVPMFHVNAWGLPYAGALVGAKLVFAGPTAIGRSLAELLEGERVTLTAGVPTVFAMLDQHLRQHPHDLSRLKRIYIGGAATPASLIEKYDRDHGLKIIPAWGMTETTPVGLVGRDVTAMPRIPEERRRAERIKPGPPIVGVDVRIVGNAGDDLPWDGRKTGELLVRGPWVARKYYENTEPEAARAFTADGWFRTGDIATIDEFGYVQVTDRLKDLVKCKGEWISSVDMENLLTAHPGVAEAAVVARPDPKRDEVPVIFAVRREGVEPAVEVHDLLAHLEPSFARWQIPRVHDVHLVDSIPKTTVGKIDKKALRARLTERP